MTRRLCLVAFAVSFVCFIEFRVALGGCDPVEGMTRAALLTSMQGREVEITVSLAGKEIKLKGAIQNELEFRANFPRFPIKAENGQFDRMETLQSSQDIVRSMLEHESFPLDETNFLAFRPLGERAILGQHLKPDEVIPVDNLREGDFTREIASSYSRQGFAEHDPRRLVFKIGAQIEKSIYFDTVSRTYEKDGIAIRTKEWFTQDSAGRADAKPVARSVFIKVADGNEGIWTQRKEFHVKIPTEWSQTDVTLVAEAMLKQLNISKNLKISPQVRIENLRLSFDLIAHGPKDKNPEKIGFFVIDQFQGTNLSDSKTAEPISQMELEIFPEKLAFYQKHQSKFNSILSSLISDYGAHKEDLPKYRQISQDP